MFWLWHFLVTNNKYRIKLIKAMGFCWLPCACLSVKRIVESFIGAAQQYARNRIKNQQQESICQIKYHFESYHFWYPIYEAFLSRFIIILRVFSANKNPRFLMSMLASACNLLHWAASLPKLTIYPFPSNLSALRNPLILLKHFAFCKRYDERNPFQAYNFRT